MTQTLMDLLKTGEPICYLLKIATLRNHQNKFILKCLRKIIAVTFNADFISVGNLKWGGGLNSNLIYGKIV